MCRISRIFFSDTLSLQSSLYFYSAHGTSINLIIYQAAARTNLKRVSLELGGKSPLVIFDDVEDLGNPLPLVCTIPQEIKTKK